MNTTNERPTPETDAMLHADWHRLEEYSAPLSAYRRMTALCQTLERERDEAQTALDEIEKYGTEEINAAVDLRRQLAAALIERDEACEKLAAERALVDWLAGMVDPYYADDDIAHYAGIADAIAARKEARNDQTGSS